MGKKTAIEDLDNRKCFIMDLDENLVKPPTSVWELIVKIRRGDYFPQEEVIRRTMRVDRGPLTLEELRPFGRWIYNACGGLPTYTLVNVDEADPFSTGNPETAMMTTSASTGARGVPVATAISPFFAGKNIAEIRVVD